MLMVCTAWAVEESCAAFNASIPPAGAILARVLSFRAPAKAFLVLADDEMVELAVVVTKGVGLVVAGVVS